MKPTLAQSACVLLTATAAALAAASPAGKRFDSHDWTLVCDNTRTCRAAGYSRDHTGTDISVLLTRSGGGNSPVQAKARFNTHTVAPHLWIAQSDNGTLIQHPQETTWSLSSAQTQALLNALRAASGQVTFTDAGQRHTLSTRGAYAVLLKMDDWQGRLDTPGALMRPGNRPEQTVPASLPAAKIAYQKPSLQPAWIANAQALSLPTLRAELIDQYAAQLRQDCPNLAPLHGTPDTFALHVTPLSATNAVATGLCRRAAHHEDYGVWLINNQSPFQPTLVTTVANAYAGNGIIEVVQKDRERGDCGWRQTFAWDGKRFVLALEYETGLCRGFAGGAWVLPKWVSQFHTPQ